METLSILLFNWRDICNPDAGGAEVFTHEVAKRWATQGHEVSLFTSRFPGSGERERIDGVDVFRAGNRVTVYRQAIRFWRRSQSHAYDVVIDEINTRPFMTPTFVDSETKVFALIHQLAREYWFYEVPFPLSYIGYYFLETHWLKKYRKFPCITVSESTKLELHELGFDNVSVVSEGISVRPLSEVPDKPARPTFIYLGRLTRAKKPEDAVAAFGLAKKVLPSARLWVVGEGYMRKRLEKGAPNDVEFMGGVTESEKFRLLRDSHILLVPGTREGWGLVVSEANAMGTPAIAYDVPGLRDSVLHEKTGIVLKENTPRAMADWCVRLLQQPILRSQLAERALDWSRRFSWDLTAKQFMEILRPRSTHG